jgi:SPOR domain
VRLRRERRSAPSGPREEPRPRAPSWSVAAALLLLTLAAAGNAAEGTGGRPPSSGPFAVQIRADRLPAPAFDEALPVALPGARLYTVEVERDGTRWRRIRLGLFATRAEAERARARLSASFPGAFVVQAEPGEGGAAADAPAEPPRATARTGAPSGPPSPPPASASSGNEEVERRMAEGRAALAAGDPERAIGLFTAVLELPQGTGLPEARELLGLARERNGQIAHARAEYQTYLEQFPEGEGADRVRQRLSALDLAQAGPVPKLREAKGASGPPAEVHGSLGAYYRSFQYVGDGHVTSDSYVFNDLFLSGRVRTGRVDLRAETATSYLQGIGRSGNETLVRSLFLAAEDRLGPLSASLGRFSAGASEALYRYDGLKLGYRMGERWRLSAVGGFPVDLYTSNAVQTKRPFYGLTLDTTALAGALDVQLFALQENDQGRTDRTSLGGSFRYVGERAFASAFLDYDAHFGALDAAVLNGSWQLTTATTLSAFADYRHLPSLSLRNALIGQPTDSLDDLGAGLDTGDLESLAEDRTARSLLGSLGLSHRLGERFELAGDFSVSEVGSTPSSGGVAGYPGTGFEYWYQVQLAGSDLLAEGDRGQLGLRYVLGRDRARYALLLDLRLPTARGLRVGPRMIFEYRAPDSRLYLRPGVQLEYRAGRFTVEGEAALEWAEGEFARALLVGLRYDF